MQITKQLIKWFHKRNRPKNRIKKRDVDQYKYINGKGKEFFRKYSKGRPLKITADELFYIIDMHKLRNNTDTIFNSREWHHNITAYSIGIAIQRYKNGCFDDCIIKFINSGEFEDRRIKDYL